MAAIRLFPREAWEERLRREGCSPYRPDGEESDPLATAEVWQTPHGKIFIVPMDNSDGKLRSDDLQQVLIQVAKLRPLDI